MKKILGLAFILGTVLSFSVPIVDAKMKVSSYGPTALCRDGTYSYSANHRGTCSWHKGVKIWFR